MHEPASWEADRHDYNVLHNTATTEKVMIFNLYLSSILFVIG